MAVTVPTLRTQYAFTLPRGYVDASGAVHREGLMRLATARDELEPLRDPAVRENEAYLTVLLLARVILRIAVSSFLTRTWREGALFGATPDEAFYVKCDEETNPPDVIDAGQVVMEIGISPVKPAEFVIFRIRQTRAGGAAEE